MTDKLFPSVTLEQIENKIVQESYFRIPESNITHCSLKMENGYIVTGEGSCVCEENFDRNEGERLARLKAIDKLWPLEGYLLKQELYLKELEDGD